MNHVRSLHSLLYKIFPTLLMVTQIVWFLSSIDEGPFFLQSSNLYGFRTHSRWLNHINDPRNLVELKKLLLLPHFTTSGDLISKHFAIKRFFLKINKANVGDTLFISIQRVLYPRFTRSVDRIGPLQRRRSKAAVTLNVPLHTY